MKKIIWLLLALCLSSCSTSPKEKPQNSTNPLSVKLQGNTCRYWTDPEGVTHFRSDDELTTFACFGYIHARERAFQMEYLRRAAYGRLSEALGGENLKSDFFLRLMGIAEKAEKLYLEIEPALREKLLAYAYGVNQGFQTPPARQNYAFQRIGVEPETWHAHDSLALLMLQSLFETQSSFWNKLKEVAQQEAFGPEALKLFGPEGFPWETTVIKKDEITLTKSLEKKTGPQSTSHWTPGPVPWEREEGTGSNNWVISPSKSHSGKAWLANDPHLELQHPPFWHWVHAESKQFDVMGASVPGIPIIPSGFNRHTAWGLTDAYIEVGDIVAIPKEDTAKFTRHTPRIWVRWNGIQFPFALKSYLRSPEGYPVLPVEGPNGKVLVLRWSGFHVTGKGVSSLFDLFHADSVKAIETMLTRLEVPSWNFVFSDDKGNIGYRAQGLLPRRESAGWGVREGKASELKQWDFLTAEESPHLINPKRGFIATGNNQQWPANSRFSAGAAHPLSLRAFRIEEKILQNPKHDLVSIQKIQCDAQAVDARFIVPRLLAFAKAKKWSDSESQAVDILSHWDYEMGLTCQACGLYELWVETLLTKLSLNRGALYKKLEKTHTIDAALVSTFQETVAALKGPGGFPPWELLVQSHFRHLSKSSAISSDTFLATTGNVHSVSPAKLNWMERYFDQRSGASQRLIVEMTSPPTAYFAIAGPNQDIEKKDLTGKDSAWLRWRDCQYSRARYPLDWTKIETTDWVL